jgi:uncharacterized protein YfiM (DUF2279 family)
MRWACALASGVLAAAPSRAQEIAAPDTVRVATDTTISDTPAPRTTYGVPDTSRPAGDEPTLRLPTPDARLLPSLAVPAAEWLTAAHPASGRARRDIGAASYGWCARGGVARRSAQVAAAGVFIGANLGLYEYFRRAWWSGEEQDFWVNWDWDVLFRGQDKFGHLHGGYVLAEAGREVLEAACVSEKRAAVIGALYAAAFQLQIEIWDGGQRAYGFSPPDLIFNTIGQGLSVAHTFVPVTRAILPTFSYQRTPALKAVQSGAIPGDLRPSVDYSGQTYWLSIDVDTLLTGRAKRLWPGLLRFSLGHTITDWVDPVNGAQIRARRRIMLSLDVDPLRLPGRAPWWVATKKVLRHYRFPAPAIEIMSTGIRGIAWHR